jgi:hypothetical protein
MLRRKGGRMSSRNVFTRLGCMAAVALAGCASVSLAPDELDARAKLFSLPPQKANIYVTRQFAPGSVHLYQVFLDGKLAGSIAPITYLMFEVEPGNHQVVVTGQESQHAVTVAVTAGESQFLDVELGLGWMVPRAELVLMSPKDGRAVVEGAKRAEDLLAVTAAPAKPRSVAEELDARPQGENIRFQSQGAGTTDRGIARGWMECGNAPCPKTPPR